MKKLKLVKFQSKRSNKDYQQKEAIRTTKIQDYEKQIY